MQETASFRVPRWQGGPRSEKKERRIMRRFTGEILVISGVSLLAFGSIADAAGPAQADFDVCNREAHAQAASPSATPATGGDTATKPGTPVSPSAAPATKTPVTPSPAPTPRADTGTKPGTPVSPSAAPGIETPTTPSPAPTSAAGTSSGSSASNDSTRGMAAAGQADPAFRQAYMDCMKRRGF
jgi:hypothetical protein